MKSIVMAIVILAFSLSSCAQLFSGLRFRPEYPGVDERAKPLVEQFLSLSAQNNLVFSETVTLGFTKIDQENIAGVCYFGNGFREIEIDIDYWNNTTPSERMVLVFHELAHCYCSREHNWALNKRYPPTEEGRIEEAKEWLKNGGPKPGRFDEDACPTSIMYPAVIDPECVFRHYDHYLHEMFDRCEPY